VYFHEYPAIKTKSSQKMSSSIRLCAAICADHFDKKIL
jgi:hypothetical protein